MGANGVLFAPCPQQMPRRAANVHGFFLSLNLRELGPRRAAYAALHDLRRAHCLTGLAEQLAEDSLAGDHLQARPRRLGLGGEAGRNRWELFPRILHSHG